MAWKKLGSEVKEDPIQDIWVSLGKEREGYYPLMEGEELIGYFEKLNYSQKYEKSVLSLISDDRKVRYNIFCPDNLARKFERLEEEAGAGVLVRVVYEGKKTFQNKEGYMVTYHSFDVEYDPDKRIEVKKK